VAFSLSFENDYPNILKIMEMGRIPLLSKERSDPLPFILAGGITTFLNPEPIAVFIDFFLMGEAEVNLNEFIDHFFAFRSTRLKRSEIGRNLAEAIDTVYVPSFYEPEYNQDGTLKSFSPTERGIPAKVKVDHQSSADQQVALSAITTPDTEFGNRILIELGRGCARSCRFCAAGYVYRPPRVHAEAELRAAVETTMQQVKQVGLLSPAVSDIPGIENVTALILEREGRFSVSSLRADTLSQNLLDHLKEVGQRTVAIAPEAGSERLRRVINKHLTSEQIMHAVNLIARTQDFAIRLYFLIGLPTETREDLVELVKLVKGIKYDMVKLSARRGKIGQLRLSVNCFIPKPFTPFQWSSLENISSLKKKQQWLKKSLTKEGGIRVNAELPRWAYVQTLLSVGDRRVGPLLSMSHRLGGNWKRAFRLSEVDPDFFVYRKKGLNEMLPWDFIDHGISKRHLVEEYELALKAEESDVCHVGECYRCGVCSEFKQ
jgi:radical SAM superfamily enzyme YgiQ (UPF0313 family)